MLLKGKSIVIIGGSTGLGLSAALAFSKEGASLVIVGRNSDSLTNAASHITGPVETLVGDATDPETSVKAIEIAAQKFGKLDGLYHVAGGSGRRMGDGPLHEISDEGWTFTLNLNLTSLFYSNRAAAQQFLSQGGGGVILNMGSVLGAYPSPEHFASHAYAATKSAIIGFTKSTASYYVRDNIRINVLAPALVETPMAKRALTDQQILDFVSAKQPLDGGRHGVPSDLDAAAVYFMSDGSHFTTGQVLYVDGGWSVSEGRISRGVEE